MDPHLSSLVDAFAGRTILVLGDAMLDSYLEGSTNRLCREAPVPNVTLSRRTDAPGGAANTAVNVRSLGGQVHYLTVVGDDLEGAFLRRALEEHGVSTRHVLAQPGRRTLAKHRIVVAGQILMRFDQGEAGPIEPSMEQTLLARLTDLFARVDAILVSDYDAGVITPRVLERLTELQARQPRTLVVDSRHRLAAFRRLGPSAVKPNYEEVLELLGLRSPENDEHDRATEIAQHAESILALTGARLACVTLDCDGALLLQRGHSPYRCYGRPARAPCVAGAGDTFISALTLALTAGADACEACELATAAAALVVTKSGTAACSAEELRAFVAPVGKYAPDRGRLAAQVEFYRRQGKRVVFTNGCFDILHRGHVAYLNQARELGDILIVGLNADESIRRLKGPGRPINTLEDRIQVLSALSCIDHIVAFDEDTSCNLVRALKPDVFVKGGDYTRGSLPEAPLVEELGGKVHFLPYLPDRSTSGIIERIHQVYAGASGAETKGTGPLNSQVQSSLFPDGRPEHVPAEVH